MSDSSSGKEEENESLSDGWTFVDDDESAGNGQSIEDNGEEENNSQSGCWSAFNEDEDLKYNLFARVGKESLSSGWSAFEDSENDLLPQDNNEDQEGGVTPPPEEEEEVEVEVEVTEEEEEEEDLSKGQQVQEVKVISGTESSDIETIECPQVEELRELYVSQIPSNHGMRDSFNSFFSRGASYSDTVDADTESLSSEGTPEEKVRRRRTRKPEAIQDEDTDLSLASSPSLPDDLPAIKPDSQYVHTPRPDINHRLNLIVGFTSILAFGLFMGHFLGWSRRSLWDENLNAAQVRKLRELQDSLLSCMSASSPTTDGASHIPSLRCSASSERIDFDVDPTFKSNIIQPHKYDPSSGSPMVETFVEPLEDTGIIFNAIPFHEQQYEPLSQADVDNTEELLLPDYEDAPSLQLDDPSFSSPGISENISTNIIEDKDLIDDKHIDNLSINFPQIETHHVDEIQITENIDNNNPVIEFDSDSNSPRIENNDLSNDKRYDNPIIEITKFDVNKQDEGFTTNKNLKVTNEFLSNHLGNNMNPIIDMFLNYDQDEESPNKNLNTGNDLLNDRLGNISPIIEMILKSDKQKGVPSSVDDIRKRLQQYFTSLMERDNDNLPIHSMNSKDIDLDISENDPDIKVNHGNSIYNEQNIIEELIDDEEYESSLPHIQNSWVPNNKKSASEMNSEFEEEHSNKKQDILEENEKDTLVLKNEKLEINHASTSDYDQVEVNNEFIEPVRKINSPYKEEYPSGKLKTLEKRKNEAFIDVDVLKSENKIYTCKNGMPNCAEIENIGLGSRHIFESLDNDNLEEFLSTLMKENNLELMKDSVLYYTLLNSFHRLYDKNLFENNLMKDPYILFLEGFNEILIANFPEEFRKRKVFHKRIIKGESDGIELDKPILDYRIKKEICKFLQGNIKLQHLFPFDLQFHCDDHLNIIETNMQILENLKLENEELQERVSELQAEHTEPFKIKGKDGKEARSLRERINHLIAENEDMRLALSRYQYSGLPDADKGEFNKVSQDNQHLRKTVLQLTHLVPDNDKLEVSLQYFKDQHQDLLRKVGKIRHEQPLPKELTPMIKQLEEMRSVVAQEAKKKNPPSSIANARSYLTYMGQVFSQFTYLHDWEEKSPAEKIDLAKDIFAYWLPKGVKLSPKMQDDIVKTRSHFNTIKSSIRKKWKQLKDFTNPDTIVTVGQSTVTKMNRVIVNVVNKMKDIGQTTIMSTNKQLEHSIYALSQGLAKLNKQFDETWKSLEIRIAMSEKYDLDANEDEDEDHNNDDDDEDDDDNNDDDDEDVIGNYIKSSTNDEEEFVVENVDVKHKSQAPNTAEKPDVEEKPTLDTHKIKEEVHKQIMDKEIEKVKGKDHHKREPYHDKRKEFEKKKKVDVKEEKKPTPAKFAKANEKEVPKAKGGEWHKEEKKDTYVKEDKKEEKKSLTDRIKEKREEKQTKEDSRYFKGQYNKFDKIKEDSGKPAPDYSRKQQKRKDDNDDDDEDEVADTKKTTGLKRHWEKPQKKNYFREHSGPKKQFIRRRGEEDEGPARDKRDVREKKQDKKRLETKEGKEWNKKDNRRDNYNKDDRRNKDNKDDRRNKDNKDDRRNKNNKDDRRNKDTKEHKSKSKENKYNYKNKDLNSKYLKRESKHEIKVGFDFKKGMYRNREKYVPKSHGVKFLKTSPDLVVPPRYNIQQLRHKDN